MVATVKLKIKQLRKPKIKPRKSIELLGKDFVIADRYVVEVRNRYVVLENELESEGAEDAIPDCRRRRKKAWMTVIFDMMDDRRRLKDQDEVQYRIKNTEIHQ